MNLKQKIIFICFLIFIFNFLFTACSTSDKTIKNSVKAGIINPDLITRLSVSFISYGTGIDFETKKIFNDYISNYEIKNKIKLSYEIVNWGREGEIDYCFKLSELKSKQQEKFIADLKETLKNSKLVRYTENKPCKKT